jgi:hypothetical protein
MQKMRPVRIVVGIALAQVRGSGRYMQPFHNRVLAGQIF